MSRVRVATYNLHSGVGVDRRFRPQRIIDVIGELDADIVALQEVLSPVSGFDVHAHLREATGFHFAAAATLQLAGGTFGNALLSRWPIVDCIARDLSVGTREPRGALDAIVARDGRELRVIATHLGLRASERAEQVTRLVEHARGGPDVPVILAGDFNVARAKGRELRTCVAHFGAVKTLPTFPSFAPVLPLDRIFVDPRGALFEVSVHRSRRARIASDHLPLIATLDL